MVAVIMQQKSSHTQDLVSNQSFAGRLAAAEGQIGVSGDESDSLPRRMERVSLPPGAASISLDAAEDMQLYDAAADLRRLLDNGLIPESAKDELAEILDSVECGLLDPAYHAVALGALHQLTAAYRRIAQHKAERAEIMAERQAARAAKAEALKEATEFRADRRRRLQAETETAEAIQRQRLDAIRRDAIALGVDDRRERAERSKAAKEQRRREAERRAVERAEREAARLAAWPRKLAFT